VTGGSLIRNAIEQGVSAARAVAEELGSPKREAARSVKLGGTEDTRADLVVVGAGPAGLAAGLEAKRRGVGVVVLEQASIAESIRRYSREKLVLDSQPSASDDLPLFIADSTKEELLRRWLREVRARGLEVREGARVVRIESRADGTFSVHAVSPTGGSVSIPCRRVVVATGRRGSPRKLETPIPEAALGRVHYELSDARAFAGARAVVVGLGDVAMETALALALVPGTSVTMVHRGSGFSRGRQANVERVGRRVAEGRIGIVFDAEVRAVGLERLVVSNRGSERTIAYDALFVHIGAAAKAVVPITSGRH
jgi:thioredoxin reductase